MGVSQHTLKNYFDGKPLSTIDDNLIPHDNKSAKLWRAKNLQMKKKIGSGPLAIVLEANNIKTGKNCAIKIFEYTSRNDDIFKYAIEKSKKLIKVTEKLDHPNILRTYICQALDLESNFALKSRFAIVMDLYKENLRQHITKRLIKNFYFNELELLIMLMQIASGLMYMEEIGIYHHNIKEENIFIESNSSNINNDEFIANDINSNTNNNSTISTAANSADDSEYLNPKSSQQKIYISNPGYFNTITCIIGDMDICSNVRKNDPKDSIYYPPEMTIENFKHTMHMNIYKSDVYALGIIMIKACKLIDQFIFEDKKCIKFYLEEIKEKFPILSKILMRMLKDNANDRANFEQIFKYCQEHIIKAQRLYNPSNNILSSIQKKIKECIDCAARLKHEKNFIKAIEYCDKAEQYISSFESINYCDYILSSMCYQEKGLIFEKQKFFKKALECYLKAIEIKKNHLDSYGVYSAYFEIGYMYYKIDDYKSALVYFIQAYAELNKTKHSSMKIKENRIKCLEKIIYIYDLMGDYHTALENNCICLNIIKDVNGIKSQLYRRKLRITANAFKNLGQIYEYKMLQEQIDELEKLGYDECDEYSKILDVQK